MSETKIAGHKPPPPHDRLATPVHARDVPSPDIADLVASNRELAEAIRLQTIGLHALADAIAAPMGEEPEQTDGVERYMDGTPVES